VTKGALVAVALVYIFLWVLALHGASNLIPMLAVPLILAILVAVGVWIQNFVGVKPRQQHFAERADEVDDVTPATDDVGTTSDAPLATTTSPEASSETPTPTNGATHDPADRATDDDRADPAT
jgi:cytoskeletal protein RodZ